MESKYIYIYTYSCLGNKNPAVLGDIQLNGGRWSLDSLSLLDPVTMNERLLSWKPGGWMSPSPWTHILSVGCFRGVFLACTSTNIISNTPKATPPNQLNGFVPRLLFSFLVHLLEDVRILEKIREHHSMPRFASKPMALKYITIHLRNIYLKSYIIWPIFHKLFSFSKATWSREFFPHEMHLKPHLTTSNNTKITIPKPNEICWGRYSPPHFWRWFPKGLLTAPGWKQSQRASHNACFPMVTWNDVFPNSHGLVGEKKTRTLWRQSF